MDLQQVVFLSILGGGLVLFVTEQFRLDVTALLILVALSGFISEPAIIVASVFMLSGGLTATGLTEKIGVLIGRVCGARTDGCGTSCPTCG